ncbi:hypothetical protein KNSL1_012382 [Colletotrichum chrysophilum]|nr:hypothetical protein KNSL1_012382 [Colletotrichum chrysophilum]
MDDRSQRPEGAVPDADTDIASSNITTPYTEANSADDIRADGHAEQTEEDTDSDDDYTPASCNQCVWQQAKMDPGDWVEENCPWLFDGFCPCHWHDRDHHDYGFCPTSERKAFKLVKYTDTQEGNFTQLVVGDSNYVKLFSTGEAQGETRSDIKGQAQTLGLDDTMLVDDIHAQVSEASPPKEEHAEQTQTGGTAMMVTENADVEGFSTREAHGQTRNDDVLDEETFLGLGPIVEYLRAQEWAERTPQQIQEDEMKDSEQHELT